MTKSTMGKNLLFSAILFLSLAALVQAANQTKSVASTIPQNGDINPYGVAIVSRTIGNLAKGHVLVSNFNNASNLQGTGTTIVDISPGGDLKLFAQIDPKALPGSCPGGVGLTTALTVLRSGWVIVGSLPTTDGTAATAGAGCLIVLDPQGHAVETFSGGAINGPWDMTAVEFDDFAILFVTNVLNGTVAANGAVVSSGTIARIVLSAPDRDGDDKSAMPQELSTTIVGSGFGERTDPAALVIGPTGVGLNREGTLFVADALANRIAAIPNAVTRSTTAGTGITVSEGNGLNTPLGLAVARDGNILATNGGDGNLVEIAPSGRQVAVTGIDSTKAGAGTLFGLAVGPEGLYFVNDGNNTLNLLRASRP